MPSSSSSNDSLAIQPSRHISTDASKIPTSIRIQDITSLVKEGKEIPTSLGSNPQVIVQLGNISQLIQQTRMKLDAQPVAAHTLRSRCIFRGITLELESLTDIVSRVANIYDHPSRESTYKDGGLLSRAISDCLESLNSLNAIQPVEQWQNYGQRLKQLESARAMLLLFMSVQYSPQMPFSIQGTTLASSGAEGSQLAVISKSLVHNHLNTLSPGLSLAVELAIKTVNSRNGEIFEGSTFWLRPPPILQRQLRFPGFDFTIHKILHDVQSPDKARIYRIKILGYFSTLKATNIGRDWAFRIWTVPVLSSGKPVFNYCRQGDLAKIRALILSKNLPLNSVDHNGFNFIETTLSGLAIPWTSDEAYLLETRRQLDLLRFLLRSGAHPRTEAFGLELAGPPPQKQYTQYFSGPVILGSIVRELINTIVQYQYEHDLVIPTNLESHLWYYLHFASETSILGRRGNTVQPNLPSPPELPDDAEAFLVPIPGSLEPTKSLDSQLHGAIADEDHHAGTMLGPKSNPSVPVHWDNGLPHSEEQDTPMACSQSDPTTEPSDLGWSSKISRSNLDREISSTYATSPDEDEDEYQGDVYMEAVRLLENHDVLRTAFKIGLREFDANHFENELNDCLKDHAELLRRKSRTEDQKALAWYMGESCQSLANTITRHVFKDYSQTLQLIQNEIGQQPESPSDKMNRYYHGFISTDFEEAATTNAYRIQKVSQDETIVDVSTLTSNERFFLSKDAFRKFLVKMDKKTQKDHQMTLNLEYFKFAWLRSKANYLGSQMYGWWTSLLAYLETLCRPRVRPGYQRLHWKCECGKDMYGDFDNSNPGAVEEMKASLLALSSPELHMNTPKSAEPSTSPGTNQSLSPSQAPAANAENQQSMPRNNVSHTASADPRQHSADLRLDSLPPHSGTGQMSTKNRRFFELCVRGGTYRRCLREICISGVTSDGEFFKRIKTQYYQKLHWTEYCRKFRWVRAIFIRPIGVRYVRFSVQNRGTTVGIIAGENEKEPALPPEDVITEGAYHYDPCPLSPMPPIPSNIFLHELTENPEHHPSAYWMNRLPKKLGNSIFEGADHVEWGWGVHIVEWYNLPMFGILIILASIVGASGGGLWWGLKDDIQGGTGLGSMIMTGLSILVGCQVFLQQPAG